MFRMLKTGARANPAGVVTTAFLCAGLLAAQEPAAAKTVRKPPAAQAKAVDKAAAGKPTLVGSYGDWGTYEAQSAKSKICYALAQPKQRTPATLKRDSAYIFISSRPGEGVRNEVSVIMGVPMKDGTSDAKAEVGKSDFDLVTKGQNAWMKNAAQETQLIETMKKSGRMVVKAPLAKGSVSDSYSMTGLAQALERVAKDCP